MSAPSRPPGPARARREIRVGFRFFWAHFEPQSFVRWFFPFLQEEFHFIPSDRPELVIESVFQRAPKKRGWIERLTGRPAPPAAVPDFAGVPRLFWSGENKPVDMDACEFALTHNLINHPRHHRCPYWVPHLYGMGSSPEALAERARPVAEPRRFCNFLYSHSVTFRNRFMERLQRYKSVDASGKAMGRKSQRLPFDDNDFTRHTKIDYLRAFDFTIAFENASAPGYTTEKIVDPLLAGSIPIYWGDPLIEADFNPDAFLNYQRFQSYEAFLDRLKAIDGDRRAYNAMLTAPRFRHDRIPAYATREAISAFFHKIADSL